MMALVTMITLNLVTKSKKKKKSFSVLTSKQRSQFVSLVAYTTGFHCFNVCLGHDAKKMSTHIFPPRIEKMPHADSLPLRPSCQLDATLINIFTVPAKSGFPPSLSSF